MPLGRKHLRRSRDAPTGGYWPLKNYSYSAEYGTGSQMLMERWLIWASNLELLGRWAIYLGYPPPPARYIGIKTLEGKLAKVLENKKLKAKS